MNGGSSPNWSYGYTPTAAQWNAAFASKMDFNTNNNVFNVPFTFQGNSAALAVAFQNFAETFEIRTAAPTSSINLYVANGKTLFLTANATANFNLNVTMSAITQLAATLQVGLRIEIDLWVTNGATPYYMTSMQIDGASVTIIWEGNIAPSAGHANSIDRYRFDIARTGNTAYTVFGKMVQG